MSLNNIRSGYSDLPESLSQSRLCSLILSLSLLPLQPEQINCWFSARLIITTNCQIHLRVYRRDINNTLILQSLDLLRSNFCQEKRELRLRGYFMQKYMYHSNLASLQKNPPKPKNKQTIKPQTNKKTP